MPIEFTCVAMLIANAILICLIVMLVKKFKINKLRNYVQQLENEKLDDHEEILKLQYEISHFAGNDKMPNRMPSRFKLIYMN